MPDFTQNRQMQNRQMMVDCQLRTFDVTDRDVLAAMENVPREHFVPAECQALAYSDRALPMAEKGRSLLTPMVLARLIQSLGLSQYPPESPPKVLDIAGGYGYGAAILADLGAQVVMIEEDEALAAQVQHRFERFGVTTVEVHASPLDKGWAKGAPYDAILIEGACAFLPQELLSQLREGGVLVCIEGTDRATKAMLYQKTDGHVSGRPLFNAFASPLMAFTPVEDFAF
jgi:protein-L-isoaspartate(D-aspartate) O-methyltransferase